MDVYPITQMNIYEFSFLNVASRLPSVFILLFAFVKVPVINGRLMTKLLLSRLCQVAEECAKVWSRANTTRLV